ncbi:MAG: 4Fe-4S binding protein [Candidatus Coatesbacteria bacterium]
MKFLGYHVAKGMLVTISRFANTYVQGVRRTLRMAPGSGGPGSQGIFTVQYPEQRLPVPERFRVLPVLIREEATGKIRCTACGICTKVCPTQCIWIVQAKGEDGKTKNAPESFCIEPNVCMNCGLCAEYCPFNAIKMDVKFELAEYRRQEVLRLEDLLVSSEYYDRTHPQATAEAAAAAAAKAAAKAAAAAAPTPATPAPGGTHAAG